MLFLRINMTEMIFRHIMDRTQDLGNKLFAPTA